MHEDFVKSENEILTKLIDSKENGTAIGVNAPGCSADMIITAVEDIVLTEDQTLIILKPYDMTGYMLLNNRINLSEIESVYAFTSTFKNPFLENLEKEKTWFF
jgi:hypothetical protein